MPSITVKRVDGWWYLYLNGRQDRFGYSNTAGVLSRYYSIVTGWI